MVVQVVELVEMGAECTMGFTVVAQGEELRE